MPEQISKYPEVTLQVLQGAGGVCGKGAEQKILTRCPAERFCALPTGEICVYGLEQIPHMTQITVQEVARVVCPLSQASVFPVMDPTVQGILLGSCFALGLLLGRLWRRRGRSI
jgi:hypothetical protein